MPTSPFSIPNNIVLSLEESKLTGDHRTVIVIVKKVIHLSNTLASLK